MAASRVSVCSEDELFDWQGTPDDGVASTVDTDCVVNNNNTVSVSDAGISHRIYAMDARRRFVATAVNRPPSGNTVGGSKDDDSGRNNGEGDVRSRDVGGGCSSDVIGSSGTAGAEAGAFWVPLVFREGTACCLMGDIMSKIGAMLSPRLIGRLGEVPSSWTIRVQEKR